MGIEEDRFRLEWISASEGERVRRVMNEMAEKVRALGPLGLPSRFQQWDREMETIEEAMRVEEGSAHAG